MKTTILGICCLALMSLASCASTSGSHDHSCKCGHSKTEKTCADGQCSLDKKCPACSEKEKG